MSKTLLKQILAAAAGFAIAAVINEKVGMSTWIKV